MSAVTQAGHDRSAVLQDLDTVRVLWKRDLMRFLRQPSRIIGAIGQPLLFWLMIGTGMAGTFQLSGDASGTSYLEYFFPGVLMMVSLFASIFSTVGVIEDRHQGFLLSVLVSPGSRSSVVLGKSLGATTVAMFQVALLLLATPWAGFGLGQVNWPGLIAALVLSSFALTAFGFAIAWWLDNVQAYHAIQMTLLVPLWVVSGAMFPVPEGGVFAALMKVNPLTFTVDAVRLGLYGSEVPPTLAHPSLGLGANLIVLTVGALASYALAVTMVHRRR